MLDVNGLQCSSNISLARATAQNAVCQTFWILLLFGKISTRDGVTTITNQKNNTYKNFFVMPC